jgi:hypothetical protein
LKTFSTSENSRNARQKIVAERRGKLASYEVAGVGGQNKFVPQGTMEASGHFPASFQDAMICGRESSHNVAG